MGAIHPRRSTASVSRDPGFAPESTVRLRLPRSVVVLGTGAVSILALSLGACEGDPVRVSDEPSRTSDSPEPAFRGASFARMGALAGQLPSSDTVTSGVPAFEIKQKGGGIGGRFEITNPNSAGIALDGVNAGTGHALLAWNLGRGRGAVVITSNSANTLPALDVSSQSLGVAATGSSPGLAAAMDVRANNASASTPAAQIATLGTGNVLNVNHRGSCSSTKTECNLAVFQVAGANKIRFARGGRGFFNGGVQSSGADVAEAFQVEGKVTEYRPGDVLVISETTDRTVEKSSERYSTRVIGVYATRPGVLLSERGIDQSLDDLVPVGVIGVIPTRVSAENGAIRRGDLLVTAGTPGHAMRAKAVEIDGIKIYPNGALLGKALEAFDGPGTGMIRVMVNVK